MVRRGQPNPNAGRKPLYNVPLRQLKVYLTDEQIKLLRRYGRGNVSGGLRWLIEQSEGLIRKVKADEIEALRNSD